MTDPSALDQYFMPPNLAAPPGYLRKSRAALALPHAPSGEGSKHRKKAELDDWQVPISFYAVLFQFQAIYA